MNVYMSSVSVLTPCLGSGKYNGPFDNVEAGSSIQGCEIMPSKLLGAGSNSESIPIGLHIKRYNFTADINLDFKFKGVTATTDEHRLTKSPVT